MPFCVFNFFTGRCVRCGIRLADATKADRNPCKLTSIHRRAVRPRKPRKVLPND